MLFSLRTYLVPLPEPIFSSAPFFTNMAIFLDAVDRGIFKAVIISPMVSSEAISKSSKIRLKSSPLNCVARLVRLGRGNMHLTELSVSIIVGSLSPRCS